MFGLFKSKPVPVVTQQLHSRSRDWTVETTPSGTPSGYANFRQLRLVRHTETEFVLGPAVGARVVGLIFVCFGIGILAAYVGTVIRKGIPSLPPGFWQGVGAVFVCAMGLVFAVMFIGMGLISMTQTIRLDKQAGTVTHRWLMRTVSVRSLGEVIGVQWLALGEVGLGRGVRVELWQVNLVLEFPPGDRANLCTECDRAFTREVAAGLAAFLGVPLLEGSANK